MRIQDLIITPIAFRDPPLLNSTGVHEPLALRCVVQLRAEGSVTGWGECHGDRRLLDRLAAAQEAVRGCAWTPGTAHAVARELGGALEYQEDPTGGVEGMAEVARKAPMPLAMNMSVVPFDTVPAAVRHDAVQVVLSDHHSWGGLRRTHELGALCSTFGIGLSMHSNSHLGISLAAMTHVAAASPYLTYACDTHYPWNAEDDVVRPGVLRFVDGSVPAPTGPGLGVGTRPRHARPAAPELPGSGPRPQGRHRIHATFPSGFRSRVAQVVRHTAPCGRKRKPSPLSRITDSERRSGCLPH